MRIGFAQNRMQSRHNLHAQFAQQGENMAAGPPAENAILELQAHEIYIIDIQEVGGATIRIDILLGELESDPGWVSVAAFHVVNRHGDARCVAVFGGDGLTQVGGKRGNTALARQVVSDKRNTADGRIVRAYVHDGKYPSL